MTERERAMRTLFQLVVAGAFTQLIASATNGIDPTARMAVLALMTVLTSYCQNWLEERGAIPAMMKAQRT